jgi:hypothetical protein
MILCHNIPYLGSCNVTFVVSRKVFTIFFRQALARVGYSKSKGLVSHSDIHAGYRNFVFQAKAQFSTRVK